MHKTSSLIRQRLHDKAPAGGWGLHLVIEDPEEGLAIALRATDVE